MDHRIGYGFLNSSHGILSSVEDSSFGGYTVAPALILNSFLIITMMEMPNDIRLKKQEWKDQFEYDPTES